MTATPRKPYKPLFNKTYLKYLGFIVAIAIILLSAKPATPLDQPKIMAGFKSQLHVLQVEEIAVQRLLLSFITAPAFTNEAKTTRALQYQALRKSANQMQNIHSILWTYDRLEIELRWSSSKPLSIANEMQALLKNSYQFSSSKQRTLITAERYLQSKEADAAILAHFSKSIASDFQVANSIATVLQKTPAALFIIDQSIPEKSLLDVDQQLAVLYSETKPAFPDVVNWSYSNQRLVQRSNRHQRLIASQLALTSNQQNRIELLSNFVLSELLNRTLQKSAISFRLIRQPIYQRGYQILLLSSRNNISEQTLSSLKNRIQISDIDDDLTVVKKRLLDKYQALVNDRERLFKLYSKKLFYGLITESDSEYEEQLDTITPGQISAHISKLIGDNTLVIRLQPS
ncbi:MAG: hypothetical protein V7784_00825 [Oceanospirillaceae bacterium]